VALELDGHRWHHSKDEKDERKWKALRKAGIRLVRLRDGTASLAARRRCAVTSNFDSDPLPTLTMLARKIASLTSGKNTRSVFRRTPGTGRSSRTEYRTVAWSSARHLN